MGREQVLQLYDYRWLIMIFGGPAGMGDLYLIKFFFFDILYLIKLNTTQANI